MTTLATSLSQLAGLIWGLPLVFLLVGGGVLLLIHSRAMPYRYMRYAFSILKRPSGADQSHLSPYQALSTALSGTLGLGNLAGVALALSMGGAGAIFWMWVTALVGLVTKFYTASLAVMYRGKDQAGEWQGGPMYIIREAMPRKWLPLAYFFALAGLIGTNPGFQVNQLIETFRVVVAEPSGWLTQENTFSIHLGLGVFIAVVTLFIAIGQVKRVGRVAGAVVPIMLVLYIAMTVIVLVTEWQRIPATLWLIVSSAFDWSSAAGGAVGSVVLIGVQRGVFSNEAGLGTESMAHGEASVKHPVEEGLVAMLGPVIDTLIVCTCTALVILLTGVLDTDAGIQGISLTVSAFESVLPGWGRYGVGIMAVLLSITTITTCWYYGSKCAGFLFGRWAQRFYIVFYVAMILFASIASLGAVVSIIDIAYGLMAVPTMISTLYLAPKVKQAARQYFNSIEKRSL